MIEKIATLDRFIKILQKIPYLASRNTYKIASYFLAMDKQHLENFCTALMSAHDLLVKCEICYCWQEKNKTCIFCSSPDRVKGMVCVVETWHELISIEKTKGYDGLYHVLGGAISPIDGIGPNELSIEPLLQRVRSGSVDELILATNQTPEGEATASYISHKLKGVSVKITCLARGLPVGVLLEGVDRVTIYKALSERRLF